MRMSCAGARLLKIGSAVPFGYHPPTKSTLKAKNAILVDFDANRQHFEDVSSGSAIIEDVQNGKNSNCLVRERNL